MLLRKPGELQFGLDPRHALVASDLPAAIIDTLRGLDGIVDIETLFSETHSEHADALRTVLEELARRGLLEEATPHQAYPRAYGEPEHSSLRVGTRARHGRKDSIVRLYGGGRGAAATAALLATAGVGRIDLRCTGTISSSDLGTGFLDGEIGLPRRRAMAGVIHRANPKTNTTRLTGNTVPTLAVLCDAIVPDPDLALRLTADEVPHLPIRVRDGIGIVGPLVRPGRTSCLRCADLHRTDLDPCWPTVATQLAGRLRPAELNSLHALAAVATGQVLRALNPADGAPAVWNATLEVDPFEGRSHRRPWPAHPDCRCGAFDHSVCT